MMLSRESCRNDERLYRPCILCEALSLLIIPVHRPFNTFSCPAKRAVNRLPNRICNHIPIFECKLTQHVINHAIQPGGLPNTDAQPRKICRPQRAFNRPQTIVPTVTARAPKAQPTQIEMHIVNHHQNICPCNLKTPHNLRHTQTALIHIRQRLHQHQII